MLKSLVLAAIASQQASAVKLRATEDIVDPNDEWAQFPVGTEIADTFYIGDTPPSLADTNQFIG